MTLIAMKGGLARLGHRRRQHRRQLRGAKQLSAVRSAKAPVAAETARKSSQSRPNAVPKSSQCRPQVVPKPSQDRPKVVPMSFQCLPKVIPRSSQSRPKSVPGRPNVVPMRPKCEFSIENWIRHSSGTHPALIRHSSAAPRRDPPEDILGPFKPLLEP